MPIFKPISENEAKGKVKEIYDEIKSTRQMNGDVFQNTNLL